MKLDDLTIGQAKELAQLFGASNETKQTLAKVGDKVFIRTLTYHYTGRVVEDNGKFLTLVDAAWIADSGRLNEAIANGTLKEVEPIGAVKIIYNNIVDCIEWKHDLPIKVK